ncbi:MAG: hypothetical protein J1E42_03895 [Akkermansiaceae bacterium]|nr:hypothetical protein [Akkermansiaceae bacterium]
MNYLKRQFRRCAKLTCIMYVIMLIGCTCGGKLDLEDTFAFLLAGPFFAVFLLIMWEALQSHEGEKTKEEKERENILAQARSQGAKQAREYAQKSQSGTPVATSPLVCPVCQGHGKNAAGYVCPVCNGSGQSK